MESSANTGGVSGGSNARDFQPSTQNPQTGAMTLQESTLSTQPSGGNSGAINQGNLIPQSGRQLSVQTQPGSTGQIVPVQTDAGFNAVSFLIPVIMTAAAICLLLVILRNRRSQPATIDQPMQAVVLEKPSKAAIKKKQATKKRKPKKKK